MGSFKNGSDSGPVSLSCGASGTGTERSAYSPMEKQRTFVVILWGELREAKMIFV